MTISLLKHLRSSCVPNCRLLLKVLSLGKQKLTNKKGHLLNAIGNDALKANSCLLHN